MRWPIFVDAATALALFPLPISNPACPVYPICIPPGCVFRLAIATESQGWPDRLEMNSFEGAGWF